MFDTVAEAVADCRTSMPPPCAGATWSCRWSTPRRWRREIHGSPGRSAILFGPERSGLETEDVALAGKIVTVPINPEFGSLNLAQAVILLAYEWSRGRPLAQPTVKDIEPPAPQAELEGLIGQLDDGARRARAIIFPPDRTAGDPPHDPHHPDQARLVEPRGQGAARHDPLARQAARQALAAQSTCRTSPVRSAIEVSMRSLVWLAPIMLAIDPASRASAAASTFDH